MAYRQQSAIINTRQVHQCHCCHCHKNHQTFIKQRMSSEYKCPLPLRYVCVPRRHWESTLLHMSVSTMAEVPRVCLHKTYSKSLFNNYWQEQLHYIHLSLSGYSVFQALGVNDPTAQTTTAQLRERHHLLYVPLCVHHSSFIIPGHHSNIYTSNLKLVNTEHVVYSLWELGQLNCCSIHSFGSRT